ncbi:MAG: histidine phosphatase family protein, partial [Monoglobales bacterium]
MKKTRFIIVRHAEAEGNIIRIFHGHYNSSLTEDGHIQAKRAAEALKKYKIDHIYSSDLNRTVSTAEYISSCSGLEIKKDERLREINGGGWENVPWDDLPSLFPESYKHWEND